VKQVIELSEMQRAAIKAAFQPFANSIAVVGVYGSRAQGVARPGSDVDLVVYGDLNDRDFDLIRGELEAGDLSIFVDLVRYEDIQHAALKTQIDNWMKPLFHRNELLN
jgi:uncharacterized protein